MGRVVRLRSTIARPADLTAYTAGDEISNSATAGSVSRMTFDMQGLENGQILSAKVDLTAASGDVVTTAADFELLIFRTSEVPAAVGDNVTNPIAAATRSLAVARFRLDDGGWYNPLGAVAAGTSQFQAVPPTLVQPLATPVLEFPVFGVPFTFDGAPLTVAGRQFTAILRALGAWTPGAVVNTFGVTLDIDVT
jgi:hypothetical protein